MDLRKLKEEYENITYLSGNEALAAVKKDGYFLKYIKEQHWKYVWPP